MYSESATPVAVEGVGGTGTLTGVARLVSDSAGFCALLTSGEVDCWGYGEYGELGNGTFYTSAPYGSAIPVEVEGVGGTGTLTGVASLVGDDNNSGAMGSGPPASYCAVLTSGGVDCWGTGESGELGNGVIYNQLPNGSSTPVEVG
jgi:alpha-tubulin suppressor-like RCC1 family protein